MVDYFYNQIALYQDEEKVPYHIINHPSIYPTIFIPLLQKNTINIYGQKI